jgi:hypothetical protein
MKKIAYITALIVILTGLHSCELTSEVYDNIDASMYPSTARDARDLVTNSYRCFTNNGYDGLFNAATGITLTTDMVTDFGRCVWGDKCWPYMNWADFDKTEERNLTRTWGFLNNISKMTLNIDRIEKIEMDADLKKQYIAELHAGKGFLAFLVYDVHGPIVVADLETLKNPQGEQILPRLSEEDTRSFIVSELTEAINSGALEPSYTKGDADYGRFTEGLCHMVLLKFYMQTKQWDKAIAEGRELMLPKYGYALVTDKGAEKSAYANIFTQANEKNAETIWSINNLEGTQYHLWYPHALPDNLMSSEQGSFSGGWGGYKLTWDFFETFEPGDERTQVIISEYVTNDNVTLNKENPGTAPYLLHGVIPLKYKIEPSNTGDHCVTDWIVYRYADVLTLLAEAIVHQGNTVTPEAIGLLNQVRTRAGLGAYSASDFSGPDDFIDKLLWERAHELWYEGCRRQDLIRNGQYVEKMKEKCTRYGQTNSRIFQQGEQFHLFPLPESAEIASKGIIQNNPGY